MIFVFLHKRSFKAKEMVMILKNKILKSVHRWESTSPKRVIQSATYKLTARIVLLSIYLTIGNKHLVTEHCG